MADKVWFRTGPPPGKWPAGNEPCHTTAIGTPADDSLGIYLGNESMQAVDEAIAKASDQPVLGLLVGHPLRSAKRPFVLVTHVLLAPPDSPEPQSKSGSLFSSASLKRLERLWTKHHPDECIVGWFHGLPGRGEPPINPYERYTHERFFTAPWQIALLIDTDQKTSSLYHWDDKTVVANDSFYFWNSANEPLESLFVTVLPGKQPAAPNTGIELPVSPEESSLEESPSESEKRRWWLIPLFIAALYLLVSGAPGSFPWIRTQQVQQEHHLLQLQNELTGLQEHEAHLHDLATEWKENIEDTLATALKDATPDSLDTPVEVTTSPRVSQEPESVSPFDEDPVAGVGGGAVHREYVIQVGDTMWSISADFLGDPHSFRVLAEENNIDDPDIIYPGQRLQLP